MFKIKRFTDTGNIEIFSGYRCLAYSRNATLFIYDSTPADWARFICEKMGRKFQSVWVAGQVWFPKREPMPVI